MSKYNEAPSVYYHVQINCTVSTPQFKEDSEKLLLFLKDVLESYNGTEFKIHAVPVLKSSEPYT